MPPVPAAETLLQHADFIRRLAHQLAADPHSADDAMQDTWVEALERPPRGEARLRGWLRTVLLNRVRRQARSRRRQATREVRAARDEATPSTLERVSQEEVLRSVTDAILALREPLRSTVLARYYEGLTSEQIAKRDGVAAGTVRWRLKRALDQLRTDMDSSCHRRGVWLPVLLELGGTVPTSSGSPAHAPQAARASSLSVGATTTAVAVVLVLGVAASWSLLRTTDPGGLPSDTGRTPIPAMASSSEGRSPDEGEAVRVGMRPGPALTADTWSLSIQRSEGSLRGLLRDAQTGEEVAHAEVTARPYPGALPTGFELAEDRERTVTTRTDDRGEFRFEQIPEGPYELEAVGTDGTSAHGITAATEAGTFVQLELRRPVPVGEPPRDVSVFVHDADDHPVAGAAVDFTSRFDSAPRVETRTGVTNTDGLVWFRESWAYGGVLIARGPDGTIARNDYAADYRTKRRISERGALHLELQRAGAIAGTITPPGAMVVRAWARAWPAGYGGGPTVPFAADSEPDGSFRIEDLPAGPYVLTVVPPPGLRLDVEHATEYGTVQYHPEQVDVLSGEVAKVDLALVRGPTLEGRVVAADVGQPLAEARVAAVLPQGLYDAPHRVLRAGVPLWRLDAPGALETRWPPVSALTTTDARGCYRFTGLLPGPDVRIEVFAPGYAYDRRDISLTDGESVTLEHRLERAGGIQGVARSWTSLGIRRAGASEFLLSFLVPRKPVAPFTIPGLAPGRYELLSAHSDDVAPPVHLMEVDVRSGELSWVDLLDAPPYVGRARLLLEGQPFSRAVADWNEQLAMSDANGEVAFHSVFVPSNGRSMVRVRVPHRPSVPLLDFSVRGMFAGGDPVELPFPRGKLTVKLRDRYGNATQGEVRLSNHHGDGLVLPHRDDAPPVAIAWNTDPRHTDALGDVRYELVPPGKLLIRAKPLDGPILRPVVVELGAGESRAVVVRATPGGDVELRVLDARGQPLRGAKVVCYFDLESEVPPYTSRETDEHGVVRIPDAPVGAGNAYLHMDEYPNEAESRFEVRAGETTFVELRVRARD